MICSRERFTCKELRDESCNNPCISCAPNIPGAANLGLTPLDPNYPFMNLSAEAPDVDLFVSNFNPNGFGDPPLGSRWYSAGCQGLCISTVSQQAADLCAANQAATCLGGQWPDEPPGTPPPNPGDPPPQPPNRDLYFNTPQTGTFTCPDGTVFSFTVIAGVFSAFNQATANAWAASYAINQAAQNYICMSSIQGRSCVGASYDSQIIVQTPNTPISSQIVAGGLPPGMAMQQSINPNAPIFFITGASNAPGDYPFNLQITDSLGNVANKIFTISVFGIVDGSELPTANIGVAYEHSFSVGGTVAGTPTFSIVDGSLPPGLDLNTISGVLFGTPTSEGAYQFTVRVQDLLGSCDKTFDLFIDDAECTNIVTEPDLVGGTVGEVYSAQLYSQDMTGQLIWIFAGGTLPDGIGLNGNTGLISGTPTTPGDYSFTVTLTNFTDSCSREFHISVQAQPEPECQSCESPFGPYPPGFDVGTAAIECIGLDAPDPGFHLVYTMTSGVLPTGVNFVNFGPSWGLTGTIDPGAEVGTYNFCVEVTQEPD